MARKTRLTAGQKEYIVQHYMEQAAEKIAKEIGSTKSIVVRYANHQGLRKYRKEYRYTHTGQAFIPPKQLQRPAYAAGQRIKVHTQAGDKSWTKITRGATVLEVYPRGVLVGIDGKCPGVQLRYSIDYFDLQTGAAVVI